MLHLKTTFCKITDLKTLIKCLLKYMEMNSFPRKVATCRHVLLLENDSLTCIF